MIKSFWKNKKINNLIFNNYDYFVNNLNCKYVWGCDSQNISYLYKANLTKNHLEIGPGTGFFLKDNNFKNLHLMDVNNDILFTSKENLKDNCKNISIYNHNIFKEKNRMYMDVQSIGLSYVLHCVPGNLSESLNNLSNNITSDNRVKVFGSTVILNDNKLISNLEINFLNNFGIFNNKSHNYNDLNEFISDKKGKLYTINNVCIFEFNLEN